MHNLDQDVSESFEFQLKGIIYTMSYPTTEEIDKIRSMEDGSDEQAEYFYSFIKPKEPSSPNIKETIAKVNVKVLNRFNAMIKTEMTSEN